MISNFSEFNLKVFRWLKEVLLDLFQFYSNEEDISVSEGALDERSERLEFLKLIASYENCKLWGLFPASFKDYVKSIDFEESEDKESVWNDFLMKKDIALPSFDDIVRYATIFTISEANKTNFLLLL